MKEFHTFDSMTQYVGSTSMWVSGHVHNMFVGVRDSRSMSEVA